MCFSSISFSKNFLYKTRSKLFDEENGFKKVFVFYFFLQSARSLLDQKIFFFIFFLWYAFVFTRICLHKAQNNIVSALKSKPETKNWDGKTANNELSEHKTSHVSLTPYYLTTCEAPFKFVLAISQATDPSTTVFFSFFIVQHMFQREQ